MSESDKCPKCGSDKTETWKRPGASIMACHACQTVTGVGQAAADALKEIFQAKVIDVTPQ
jgi:ribosomal protein L37AE/L43A